MLISHELIIDLSDKYKSFSGDNGKLFSCEQRQGIALAGELHRDFSILVLGETTSSLSNQTQSQVSLLINKYCHSKILIFMSHPQETFLGLGKILELSSGKKFDNISF